MSSETTRWGGIASKEGFGDSGCRTADFGNACYNDHHFHFGYFVVAAAMLVKLRPEYASDVAFTSYVETLIRDTTNPSIEDSFFPAFRSFDWFDLHSWSRGVVPGPDGKERCCSDGEQPRWFIQKGFTKVSLG